MRLFLYRLILAASADVVSLVMGKLWIPNAWFVQIFHVWDVPLILVIFSVVMEDTRYQPIFRGMAVAYLVGFMAAKFTFEPLTVPDQYTYSVACLALLAGSVIVLLRVVSADGLDPFSEPWFWFSAGLTVYFASNLVLFSIWQWYATLTYDEGVRIWSIHWIGNIFVNCGFMYGFLQVRKSWTTGG